MIKRFSALETLVLVVTGVVVGAVLSWWYISLSDPLDACVLQSDHPPCVTWRAERELVDKFHQQSRQNYYNFQAPQGAGGLTKCNQAYAYLEGGQNMFHIDCFCDDKKLVAALKGLSGLVLKLEVKPVAGAVKAKGPNGTLRGVSTLEVATQFLKGRTSFTLNELRGVLSKAGYSRSAAYNAAYLLKENKLIRSKEKGKYEVI